MKKIYRSLTHPLQSFTIDVQSFTRDVQSSFRREIQSLRKDAEKLSRTLITPFLPSYQVTFAMYHVVPGQAVDRKESKFDFERGAVQEAQIFYNKVVNSTSSHGIVPAELQLKRRKKVIQTHYFGPVREIQGMLKAS